MPSQCEEDGIEDRSCDGGNSNSGSSCSSSESYNEGNEVDSNDQKDSKSLDLENEWLDELWSNDIEALEEKKSSHKEKRDLIIENNNPKYLYDENRSNENYNKDQLNCGDGSNSTDNLENVEPQYNGSPIKVVGYNTKNRSLMKSVKEKTINKVKEVRNKLWR
ncbi:hypothetical protein FDF86_01565 [Clostridium botulinum]|nr:hypothetical protein [Clostridium botulinum]